MMAPFYTPCRAILACMERVCSAILLALVCQIPVLGQPDLDRLDHYFEKALIDWGVPGMAIAIVKDDAVVFAKGYGVRELGKPDRVDEKTLFAIASNTKAFTAAALAILVDSGKLRWDDRVQNFLPYFQLYDPYVSYDFRIADLLSHRSGITTFGGDLIWYGTPYGREEIIRRARFLKQAHPFRSGYGYSNIMFIAAGEVVREAAGQSWESFVRKSILTPLGMQDTVLSVDELKGRGNVATPHAELDNQLVTFPWRGWNTTAPAGGIISSADDMARWLRLHLGRGIFEGKQVFSARQSSVMWTPHIALEVNESSRVRNPHTNFQAYGLGWAVSDYRGYLMASHGGAYDGMFSRTAMIPDRKLGVVILTNSTTNVPTALAYRVIDAYLQAEERDWSTELLKRSKEAKERTVQFRQREDRNRVANTRPSLPLEAYGGTYGGPMYGDAKVALQDGKLVLRFIPNPDLTGDLSHWHFDTFEVQWRTPFPWFGKGKVQFLLDDAGRVVEFKIDVPNEDFWFTELEFKKKLR
jgi:CubicO group peptidase (beta-lactamase class C family)